VNSSKKYKKKLVVCLSRFPYPLEKGDKLRAFFQIRDLSEFFEIYLICTIENHVKTEELDLLKKYCKEIHLFKLNRFTQIFNLLINFLSIKPFQVVYFTQYKIKKNIGFLLQKIKPDHIFCQLIRPAEYVKNYHDCPKTLDIMDALSKGMERQSKNSNFFMKLFYREESERLKKYERQIINYFENILIISKQDKEFILHPNKDKIIVLPNGVNEAFIDKTNLNFEKNIDILFTGNMNYFPNIEACKYIYKELYPFFKLNKIKTTICGANPSKVIQKLNQNDFEVTGWVEDIKRVYLKSKIFIAPMFSGTGMQNKILEAMALGIPCITTTLANNAILAKPNEEILIANTKEEFISSINLCLNDKDLYSKLAKNSQNFILENYNWKKINQNLSEIIKV
jgi:glycosyltransferase involved in cell wall biosynthesis